MIKNKNIDPSAGIDASKMASNVISTTGTQTLTNKTLTSPTINTATITGGTIGAMTNSDTKVSSADVTWNSGAGSTTLANVTGLSGVSLVAGATYEFEVVLQTNCTTNGGISVALKYTTATLTSIALSAKTVAAASIGLARSTTTTDATKFVDNKTAAWIEVTLKGSLVVNAAGTVAVQAAQNTSHADTTTVYAGSTARFTRVA